MRIITLGTFDLFHVGHVNLLRAASSYGHELFVGVNSDRFVTTYKGRPPVIPENDRMQIVRACRYVHDAQLNDGPGCDLIESVSPQIIAIGTDWHRKDYLAQIGIDENWLEQHRIGVLYLPYTPGVSSSRLREVAAA